MTTEFSKICKQLQSFLGALERRKQDIASPQVHRISRVCSGRDSKAESSNLHPGQLIWQIEEAHP